MRFIKGRLSTEVVETDDIMKIRSDFEADFKKAHTFLDSTRISIQTEWEKNHAQHSFYGGRHYLFPQLLLNYFDADREEIGFNALIHFGGISRENPDSSIFYAQSPTYYAHTFHKQKYQIPMLIKEIISFINIHYWKAPQFLYSLTHHIYQRQFLKKDEYDLMWRVGELQPGRHQCKLSATRIGLDINQDSIPLGTLNLIENQMYPTCEMNNPHLPGPNREIVERFLHEVKSNLTIHDVLGA